MSNACCDFCMERLADAWDEGVAAQCAAYNMTPDAGPNPYREQETP